MCRSHCEGVFPGEQVIDLALPVPLDDGGKGGRQPCVRIDAVHFAGLDERGDDGPVSGSGVVVGEEGDGAFDGVVDDLDSAIGQEATKAVAVFGDVGVKLQVAHIKLSYSRAFLLRAYP